MTDNLEQLEKDWPQPRPKDPSPQFFTWLNLAFAVLFAVLANLEMITRVRLWHSRHPAEQWWSLSACTAFLFLQLPWVCALRFERWIKRLATQGRVSLDIQRLIRYQIILSLLIVYLGFNMILNSVESMLR